MVVSTISTTVSHSALGMTAYSIRSGMYNLPPLDGIDRLGKAQPLHVRFGQQDGQAVFLEVLNGPGKFVSHSWRQALKGFIEQQELGAAHHRPRQRDHFLLSTAQG